MKKIVIDVLGGDNNTEEVIKGAKRIYDSIKQEYSFVLAGPKKEILKYFKEEEVILLDADVDVTNTTNPMGMLHDLDATSLVKAYAYMKEHEDCVGLLSVASTGCVLVGSIFKLGLIPGIKAPVLATELYDYQFNRFLLLDCGANVDATPKQLVDFAHIGNAYEKAMGIENPKIGLANIGAEPGKGNKQMKEAYPLLLDSGLNFVGNVEFNSVYNHFVDVIVCDGAIGNCILKNAEGAMKTAMKALSGNSAAIKLLDDMFNYTDNGAALLLGPKRIILKAHGAATEKTIVSSIEELILLDQKGLISSLTKEFCI